MNKKTHKLGRVTKVSIKPSTKRVTSLEKVRVFTKNGSSFEEVLPPRSRLQHKTMTNRACEVTPEREDFGQFTSDNDFSDDQYQKLLMEQYGFDPLIPQTITQLKELSKVLCGLSSSPGVETSSQYVDPRRRPENTPDECYVQNNDVEVDPYICDKIVSAQAPVKLDIQEEILENPQNISISEEPRVKVIVEKYCTYKKNLVELRKLVEKIVCIEYDIYYQDFARPVQKMRAYFSVKPYCSGNHEENENKLNPVSPIPSNIKRKFKISEEDLKKLKEKEIEIIDEKIAENQPYLNDLQMVLQRKQAIHKNKNRQTLDLRSLYEMAKRANLPLGFDFSHTNLLSEAEISEVKELIAQRCEATARGIHRKTIPTKISDRRNTMESAMSYFTVMDVLLNN